MKDVFVNSSLNYTVRINYQQCNNKIQDAKELFTPRIEIVELGANAVAVTNMEEALNDTSKILGLFSEFLKPRTQFEHMAHEVNSICNQWINEFAIEDLEEAARIHRDFVDAKDLKEIAAQYLGELNRTITVMYDQFVNNISPVVDTAQAYLQDNATKGNLAEAFNKLAFVRSVEVIDGINTDLLSVLKNYESSLRQSKDKLRKGYQNLLHLTLPILNNYNVYELEIVKAAAAIDDTEMQDLVRSLESDLETLTRLVEVIYDRLSEPVKELRGTIPGRSMQF